MYDLMKGVRVIEVAEHTFVPAGAMVLADWGADVIKIERVQGGDASRHLQIQGAQNPINPFFEAGNRGKRSVGLDLLHPEGQAQLRRMIETADVFVTNMRGSARKKMGIEPADLLEINPKLIYARGTGYGMHGPMAARPGFDWPSSWCYAGAAFMLTPEGGQPGNQPGSVGDLNGGLSLAGAIAAALFRRERTGQGCLIDNSLYLTGAWVMCQSILAASVGVMRPPVKPRAEVYDALTNYYRTKDGRWLAVCLLFEAWWPDFAQRLGREDLLTDPRFAKHEDRRTNHRELIAELDQAFAARTYEEWKLALADAVGVWAPVQSPAEVLTDPQALANGYLVDIQGSNGGQYTAVPSPAQFDEQPIGELKAGPRFAQHTDEVLAEIGLSPAQIDQLRTAKAIA